MTASAKGTWKLVVDFPYGIMARLKDIARTQETTVKRLILDALLVAYPTEFTSAPPLEVAGPMSTYEFGLFAQQQAKVFLPQAVPQDIHAPFDYLWQGERVNVKASSSAKTTKHGRSWVFNLHGERPDTYLFMAYDNGVHQAAWLVSANVVNQRPSCTIRETDWPTYRMRS